MSQAAVPPRAQSTPGSSPDRATAAKTADPATASRAAIQVWTGKAISDQIHSKSLSTAYGQWLFHRATRQPRLRDMYSNVSNAFDDTLLNLKVGDQHLVVSQSESYVRDLGRDLRGSLSSELKFPTANSMRELFDSCLATRQPAYARYISSLSEHNVYWETLILPLSVDERSAPVFTLSFVAMLSEKIDVLQILYDRSPVGIVAAVPIMDGRNKTDDARILTMNARARDILKQEATRIQMHSVGEMIHFLRDGLHWTGTGTSTEGQSTRIDYRDPAGLEYSMTIELINQFILISIADRSSPDPGPDTQKSNRFARLLGLS